MMISRLLRSQLEDGVCYGKAYSENLLLFPGHQPMKKTHLQLLTKPASSLPTGCLVDDRQCYEERNANIWQKLSPDASSHPTHTGMPSISFSLLFAAYSFTWTADDLITQACYSLNASGIVPDFEYCQETRN
ncbi:hypothetical protein PV11_02528 [Exophiala sideris]|uniref:Uncharacterized protein n=1 Tax=Exophiala sideris TaxID=1016849 RepID=A0A0D1ZJJ6_9EURO|nr:hypothetical protein PV11_02528 [Exophiala sideris]